MSKLKLDGRAGDSLKRVVTWTDSEDTPIDLTDASVEWGLRNGLTTRQYIDAAQAQVTNAATGEITLALTPTETRELAGKLWKYELTVTLADETRTTILHGFLSLEREVVE